MTIEHGADFRRHGTRGGNRIIKVGKQLITQHIERAAELCRTTRTQARYHADQLNGQVIANDFEHVDVIGKRRLRTFPTDLQYAKNLSTVKHGKADLATVWRHILHA